MPVGDKNYRPPIGSVVTWLEPGEPCAQFCEIASHCLEDAKKLDKLAHGWASSAEYILIAHALELSLKAFLAKRGLSEKELRNEPYGHNLDSLYDEAVKRGRTCLLSPTPSTSLLGLMSITVAATQFAMHFVTLLQPEHCLKALCYSTSLMQSCSRRRSQNREGASSLACGDTAITALTRGSV